MIISNALKYVYIAIPRTGSKSMSQWLVDYFQGEWYGAHHEWKVPDECKDFLIFTVIRNPYEIQASGWYFEPVIKPENYQKPQSYAEAVCQWVPEPDEPVSQKDFVEWSGVSQILYFEHLPQCLQELPFVDPNNVPLLPHLNAGGYRPQGNFFEIMAEGDEKLVWQGAQEDFAYFGYKRYDSGAPTIPNRSLQR
ncbi:hypothetical protein KFU94_29340 [Chloroflexi bacterium TSY]|nr:hypothetical protein [Chloroflexi bacterium TSY]